MMHGTGIEGANSARPAQLRSWWTPLTGLAPASAVTTVAIAGAIAAVATAALVIAAHLVLLPAGTWQVDEYFHFGMLSKDGSAYMISRFLTWAPRPFSELILLGYWWLVEEFRRPLVTPFLAAGWLVTGAGILAGIGAGRGLRPLAAGLAVLAMFLLGHRPAELFYWPDGFAAYGPTLAGLGFAAMWIARRPGRPWPAALGLTVAVGSSEVGLMAGGAIAAGLLVVDVITGTRPTPTSASAWRIRRALPWLLPLLLAAMTLALLLRGRVAAAAEQFQPNSLTFGHPWESVVAALHSLGPMFHSVSWLALLLLAAGVGACLVPAPRVRGLNWHIAALANGLLLGAFATIVAAYYQFGMLCCERHDGMRHCILVLTAAVVGMTLRGAWARAGAIGPIAGPVLLILSLALSLGHRPAEILADWRSLDERAVIRTRNWVNGEATGTSYMKFQLEPAGKILNGQVWPTGDASLFSDPPLLSLGILTFFHKQTLSIVR